MTIQVRLMVGFIAIVVVANTTLSLVTALHISDVVIREAQIRVRSDLTSARHLYDDYIVEMTSYLEGVSIGQAFEVPLADTDRGHLDGLLGAIQRAGRLDVLTMVGPDGTVLYRTHNPSQNGDNLESDNPVIATALRERRAVNGSIAISGETLISEGQELFERARSTTTVSSDSDSSDLHQQTVGLFIAAAVPLVDTDRPDACLGLLYGAQLLNDNVYIVDAINDGVFRGQTFEETALGRVTIFQDDMRIATDATLEDETRAIGTRLSEEVYERVLAEGRVFADRAFVVNDWYLTAYEPIRDPDDRIIGALAVALLEEPFLQQRRGILRGLLPVVGFAAVLTLALLFLVIRHTLRPIDRIITMSRAVTSGDLSARVCIRPKGEMGLLCAAIDNMADVIEDRENALKRTAQEQIGQSEKLAAIGRLAAGTAHEINNPLTGVLTFAHLLKKNKNIGAAEQQDIDVIIRETTRVREIVSGLLDFARQSPHNRQCLDLNEVIRDATALLRSQKEFALIDIQERPADDLPCVTGDKNQLEQVILNMSLNACEAMLDGGTLTISTDIQNDDVVITLSDTGTGIAEKDLRQIFDPFFTTKPVGRGTGLGLSVSYGIIQQHSGTIEVVSRLGEGSTFTIRLPSEVVRGSNGDTD